jgi:hypothetical protein
LSRKHLHTERDSGRRTSRSSKGLFNKEERWFDAKPATARLKVRALKKLKDAAA